jgi:hypothetical protein
VGKATRRVGALTLALLFVVAALAACGGGGSSGGSVDVRLTDYDVILSETSVSAGKVELAIDNSGGFVHELLVVRSDLAIDELPTTADGLFDESASSVQVVAEANDIAAGATATITEQLATGGYYLICNRPAEPGDPMTHFQHGMLAPFTVT